MNARRVLLVLLVLVTLGASCLLAIGCERSSYPNQDINSPRPGGAVLQGTVVGGSDTKFTDADGREVDPGRLVEVQVGDKTALALSQGFGKLKSGQAVEISEGYNGRWFVTALLDEAAISTPEPARPGTSTLVLKEGYTAEFAPSEVVPGRLIELPAHWGVDKAGDRVVRFDTNWSFLNGGGVDRLTLETAQPIRGGLRGSTVRLRVKSARSENTIPDPLTNEYHQILRVEVEGADDGATSTKPSNSTGTAMPVGETIEIRGTVRLKSFGDVSGVPVLVLDSPIDVAKDEYGDGPARRVGQMQLATDGDFTQFRTEHANRRVMVTGTLFYRDNDHHYTDVLVQVEKADNL